MNNNVDRVMKYLAPLVIAVAAVLIIAFLIDRGQIVNKDNNVYVRYIACALSVDPAKRDADIIAKCWDHVIKESGHEVHRYDEVGDLHPWLKSE